MTLPSRTLVGPKPLRYVNAVRTDIRRTFRRFRLLDFLRRRNGGQRASFGAAFSAA